MDLLFYIAAPLVGFLGMMSGGYWGVGCGWIVVPTMLILGMGPLEAVGIGLLQMVPSTILTVAKQAPEIGWKRGEPGRTLVLPLAFGAMTTSLLGKMLNTKLIAAFGSTRPIQWMLIGFISFIVIQTLCSRTACYNDRMPEITRGKSRIAFGTGVATGIVSSMLGLGGGIFVRPLLTSGFRVPEYYTSRIVRLLVLVTTVTGGITYLFSRTVLTCTFSVSPCWLPRAEFSVFRLVRNCTGSFTMPVMLSTSTRVLLSSRRRFRSIHCSIFSVWRH